jgi:hypothetical protein
MSDRGGSVVRIGRVRGGVQRAGDALQSRGHAVEVVQVRHDDLGACRGQRARAFVLDRAASGPAGRAGDQEQPVSVRHLNTFRRTTG